MKCDGSTHASKLVLQALFSAGLGRSATTKTIAIYWRQSWTPPCPCEEEEEAPDIQIQIEREMVDIVHLRAEADFKHFGKVWCHCWDMPGGAPGKFASVLLIDLAFVFQGAKALR